MEILKRKKKKKGGKREEGKKGEGMARGGRG